MARPTCWVLLALGATGCGVSEGDYLVYRVSVERTIVSEGCYQETDNPAIEAQQLEEQQSGSSLLTPLTYVIYFGAGERLVLDAAGVSIRGEETSDGFEFIADTVDVEYAGIDQSEAKITVTTHTTITMTVDGSAIQGERLDDQTTTCDFLTATPSMGLCDQITDCSRRTPFFGVQLDDVEVSTLINRPNPD